MPRCNQCNKFVSLEEEDPEIEELEVDEDGCVTGSVRIVNNCGECGDGLREATLEIDADHSEAVKAHKCDKKKDGLEIEQGDAERTQKTEGKGRGMKTFYGASVSYEINCACGETIVEHTWEDHVQASGMDEMQ
jgi:hypothetical protein